MPRHIQLPWPSFHAVVLSVQVLQVLLFLPTLVAALPVSLVPRQTDGQPLRISLLPGTTCLTPAPWSQILSFFLTNYIARIATFKKTSGYEGYRDYVKTGVSLFVPFLGISQAAATIARGSRFLGKDELGRALHAGTLVVVERDETWKPQDGEIILGCEIVTERRRRRRHRGSRSRSPSRSRKEAVMKVLESDLKTLMVPEKWKVQGQYHLPPGYALAKLPPGAGLQSMSHVSDKDSIILASSYNSVKSFAGVLQVIFSLYTIYGAYGFQIQTYGYAAFGFSVIPYTIMSFLNAIANLIEADYDTLFLVESEIMLEANDREEAELFIGTVASLVHDETKVEDETTECVDLLWKRDEKRAGWKVYEVSDDGDKTGRKWRVRDEEESESEDEPAITDFHQPLHHYRTRSQSPDADSEVPERKRPATQILIPAAGQFQTKRKIVKKSNKFYKWSVLSIISFALLFPYIFIAIVSQFKARESTARQRVFMLGWLIVGQAIGLLDLAVMTGRSKWWWRIFSARGKFVVCLGGIVFAVGGFVESGRMLRDFGYCFKA
ncbi:hypothetical protein RUND412_005880 [Rhizina undulata]